MFLTHRDQRDFVWLESDTAATGLDPPEGTKFLAAVLYKYWPKALNNKWVGPDTAGSPLKAFAQMILDDFHVRGVTYANRWTWQYRLLAITTLLERTRTGDVDARDWDAKRATELPVRTWAPEQQQAMDAIAEGLAHCDANYMQGVGLSYCF